MEVQAVHDENAFSHYPSEKSPAEELEEREKLKNPFGDKDFYKQLIPSHLQYADPKDRMATENISTRRIADHDEADPEERKQTEKVRCFIDNIRWRSEKGDRAGITWIELYVYYILHAVGGVGWGGVWVGGGGGVGGGELNLRN